METAYVPDPTRYDHATFRRCGNSGLVLPPSPSACGRTSAAPTSLRPAAPWSAAPSTAASPTSTSPTTTALPTARPKKTSATILRKDFGVEARERLRNELIISTKAGYDMWPGPYGIGASRKYLLASLDDSLKRMGLDYVDIFYAHRPWKNCPLEETMGALVSAVQQGKALYVGISSYSPERTRQAAKILKQMGVPLLIHQPSYSMLNRWIEKGLLDALEEVGAGCIAFSPLAQGLLTSKYLKGVPERFARYE